MSHLTQNIFNLLQEIRVLDPGFRALIWQRVAFLTRDNLTRLTDILDKTLLLQKEIFFRAQTEQIDSLSRADSRKIKEVKKLINRL